MCYFGGEGIGQRGSGKHGMYEVVDKDVNDLHLKPNNTMDHCNGGK